MIRLILSFFTRQPRASLDAMIARRATRLHNRSREGARAYERVHAILARGPK